MYINRLIIKGGYGEHGRSCFLLPFAPERYLMLDCGILDTDPEPYPSVEKELLDKTEYLFLSHCHKDHSGAFQYLTEHGFSGILAAAEETFKLAGISYERSVLLDGRAGEHVRLCPELSVAFGKSGHCPGGIWLEFETSMGKFFYSGDYQARPFAYRCDRIEGRKADLAIIDCAHPETEKDGDSLRGDLERRLRECLADGRRVIFPLPKYGRGLELAAFLKNRFPEAKIAADRAMTEVCGLLVKEHGEWLRPEAEEMIREFLKGSPEKRLEAGAYDFLFLADAHLEREENRKLVSEALYKGDRLLITGRIKEKGFCGRLLRDGLAEKMPYPHHQSLGDFRETIEKNQFQTVIPFHSGMREIWVRGKE